MEWKEKGGVEGERTMMTVFNYVFNFFYLIKINKLIFFNLNADVTFFYY